MDGAGGVLFIIKVSIYVLRVPDFAEMLNIFRKFGELHKTFKKISFHLLLWVKKQSCGSGSHPQEQMDSDPA